MFPGLKARLALLLLVGEPQVNPKKLKISVRITGTELGKVVWEMSSTEKPAENNSELFIRTKGMDYLQIHTQNIAFLVERLFYSQRECMLWL